MTAYPGHGVHGYFPRGAEAASTRLRMVSLRLGGSSDSDMLARTGIVVKFPASRGGRPKAGRRVFHR